MFRFARCIWHSDQAWDFSGSFHSLLVHGAQRRPTQPNGWYLFRRRFERQSSPRAATLSLTVDGRYQLFVNGGYIARGPSRASPAYQRFDVHEVTSRLRIGRNVLGVLVHVYGVDTAWYERASDFWQSIFGDGVLYCELELRDEDDFRVVPSDAGWRSRECAAWSRSTGRSGWGQAFIEDFDARRYPVGWQDIDFDDGGWPVCRELVAPATSDDLAKSWNPVEPFQTLGIAPIEPGFARFRVSPQLADLEHASDAYPTPRGPVEVSWRRTDDGCEGEIRVPTGLIAMPIAATGQVLVAGSAACSAGTHYLRFRRTTHA